MPASHVNGGSCTLVKYWFSTPMKSGNSVLFAIEAQTALHPLTLAADCLKKRYPESCWSVKSSRQQVFRVLQHLSATMTCWVKSFFHNFLIVLPFIFLFLGRSDFDTSILGSTVCTNISRVLWFFRISLAFVHVSHLVKIFCVWRWLWHVAFISTVTTVVYICLFRSIRQVVIIIKRRLIPFTRIQAMYTYVVWKLHFH